MQKTTQQVVFEKDWLKLCREKGGLRAILKDACVIQKASTIGNADEYRLHVGERDVLVKTFIDRPWFIRVFMGQQSLRHEYELQNYISLYDIACVSEPYLLFEKNTLISRFIPTNGALKNPHYKEAYQPADFFLKLMAAMDALHSNGIAHGDLRRANILVGADGNPYLIDLATAVNTNVRNSVLKRLAFHFLKRSDTFALAKIVHSYYPEIMPPGLQDALDNPPWYIRLGRFLRHQVYRRLVHHKA